MTARKSVVGRTEFDVGAIRCAARLMFDCALGFNACRTSTLDGLIAGAHPHRLGKGETLVRRGEPFDYVCVLVSGSMEARILIENGARRLLHFHQPGEIFGMTTTIDGGPHTVDLMARGAGCVVFMIPGVAVRARLEEDAGLAQAFARQLAFRSRELYERLVTDSATELGVRLARLIVGYAREYGVDKPHGRELPFKVSQVDFAEMLGATRQSVNAVIHEFREAGLITTRYSTIAVTDFGMLCERARIDKDTGRSMSRMLWPPLASGACD
jgi:CRP/FNR family transcriptional regulator, cyclic AMP receptor protein